jgi:acyl-CoA dehydrogenase
VARGEEDRGLRLSEPDAGSDVAAMQTVAARDHLTLGSGQNDSDFVLQGTKTWISNGGLADFYCVFAKTDPQGGSRGISAFIVDARARRAWTPARTSM